ncbi:hypothetical protein QFZ69_001897 [Arthrobacter sp. V1I7]|nr:hypothetical protein [Arthrobacter sp. V1I7]
MLAALHHAISHLFIVTDCKAQGDEAVLRWRDHNRDRYRKGIAHEKCVMPFRAFRD